MQRSSLVDVYSCVSAAVYRWRSNHCRLRWDFNTLSWSNEPFQDVPSPAVSNRQRLRLRFVHHFLS